VATNILFDQYGPPEVLHPVEVPDPEPGQGEVRIRVRAAGVQPFDCATRRGDYAQYTPLKLPALLGNEAAGVVDKIGPGVTGITVGEEVIAFMTMLGYSDTVVIPADQAGPKPPEMSWPEAGVLSASGQTASTAIDELNIGAADTVLIHAAAGGVGSFAVQLACARGARVIGTASERNHDYLRGLGALPVTYGPGLEDRVRDAAPNGVDAVLDAIGGEALDVSVRLMHGETKRIVTIADWSAPARLGVRRIGTERSVQRLNELTRLYQQQKLLIPVWLTFPLADAAAAHREVETGHVRGKVALTVD
jgi:enoyl reductase